MTELRLIPLDCPQCGSALAAEGQDRLFYCTSCHSGFQVREEGPVPDARAPSSETVGLPLEPVEVIFLASPGHPVDTRRPFWLLPARIEILERRTPGSTLTGLFNVFFGGDDSGGPGEGRFVVPAYPTPLERALALARSYSYRWPGAGELTGEKLTGGTVPLEDARKLAEYLLIANEADRSDTLQDLEYRLEFREPRLIGIPFYRRGEELHDCHFDLPA